MITFTIMDDISIRLLSHLDTFVAIAADELFITIDNRLTILLWIFR